MRIPKAKCLHDEYPRSDCTERGCIEKRLGIKYGEVFFKLNNIELKAEGYEGPYIEINGVKFEEQEIHTLYWNIHKALEWCQQGWAPGAC